MKTTELFNQNCCYENVNNNFYESKTKKVNKKLKSFIEEIDEWDKKNPNLIFNVGATSEIYRVAGILNKKNIYIDSKKVKKIMDDHHEMTAAVIKKIPYAINKPISIFQSTTKPGRIVIISDVFPKSISTNHIPMIVILELKPVNKNGNKINGIMVVSAYGKDSINQNWINDKSYMYISDNKIKIKRWENYTRLKLPTEINHFFKNNIVEIDKKIRYLKKNA